MPRPRKYPKTDGPACAACGKPAPPEGWRNNRGAPARQCDDCRAKARQHYHDIMSDPYTGPRYRRNRREYVLNTVVERAEYWQEYVQRRKGA